MINELIANKQMWWIATDGTTIHYGSIEPEQLLSTVFTITTYDSELDWQVALGSLGVTITSEEV